MNRGGRLDTASSGRVARCAEIGHADLLSDSAPRAEMAPTAPGAG